MSRRAAAVILFQSPAVFSLFGVKRCFLPIQSPISLGNPLKRPRLHLFSTGSSCSSPRDDLDGLVDAEFGFLPNGESADRQDHQEGSISLKDFAFLHKATAGDHEAHCEKSAGSGNFSEDAILIVNAIRACGSDFDHKTVETLRQFRGKLNESLVIEVLRLIKTPDLSLRFFIWAGRQIGYSHTDSVYDALIEILGFDKKNRVPQDFLREIEQDDQEILERLLNVLVRKCCHNGFWNDALEELGRLKDFGYKPSKVTYNALLQVLLSADQLGPAFLVHKEMSDAGFGLNRFTIGCYAQSLCKAGRWIEAINIIEREDFTLDTVLSTQMISGLLEASLFEEAMSFLHRMRSNSYVPNVVTYQTFLSGFLKKKQLGWCKRIIKMMITEGCNPSPSLFNSLMHGYCSTRDYAYAYKLLKKMIACGCQPGYVTYNIFIGGVCGNKEFPSSELLELAEHAYEEMLNAGFVLNKINVGNFAQCLCHMGKFDKAFQIIKEMMGKGFAPDSSTYTKVIDVLCQASKLEEAFLLFQEMKKNDVVPDVYTYTILIDTFCKVGLIKQASGWFNEMQINGCTPNVVTYTALIHAYLKTKQVSKANELFKSMISMGCIPNVITYTALIDGLCKAGEIDGACHIYARMRGNCEEKITDNYFNDGSIEILEPNVFTYGALVDGLCKAHKVVEARDLLNAMSSAGCDPNQIVYDALIDGFCKVGKLDDAQEVFVRMSQNGYIPSVYTYSSLIDRLFKDKRLDLALKVLSKMLESSCSPNVVTYTEMIDGLCKVGKTEEAHKLLIMMEEKGCIPNVVTYTALIDGFGKACKIDMCLELFRQMTAKSCAPNFITYRILINHCCTAGLLDVAHKLLEEMKQTYWPRHISSYSYVIQGFSKKFISSLGLLDEITNYKTIPLAPVYNILIFSFSKAGNLERAMELHKEIEGSLSGSSVANRKMYSSVIEGLCLSSQIEKAFDLYSKMITRGCVPELVIFSYLVKGLLRANKWEEGLQLLYCACHMGIDWHYDEPSDGS
ncbi:pentatricopeptide repeat-containing protein At1g06710, mitochondrial-like [Zingiber officinale]|uniref:pentatricopeptide repeat-containing protein At1g06710, mitochondrial-like n=1 Tax=Zingiber officinale TaxID=94328 RepID=UPI001C4C1BC2|nr:pentatricopeptide repeat-containing protein At1g06710, mitochondrial-like [Zingiber officinale]